MASYGRLEIYQPESSVENYNIHKDVIGIGRQQGNDIVIDRNGISRYHVTLRFTDHQMVLQDLDSVNGTYVDSTRLQANEQRILKGGEEIQLGDVRFVYYPPETLSQDTTPAQRDLTKHLQSDKMMVHLTGSDMVVLPGSNVQLNLLLENTSPETERFKITVEGVPKEWIRVDRPEFELTPGAQTQLLASFKPLRRSESKPGKYPITFVIQPQSQPEAAVRIETTLEVGTYSGYGVVMGTAAVEGNDRFQMHIHNQGNGALHVSFRGADPGGALVYTMHPPEVTLSAGERRVIEGNIKSRQGTVIGSTREYQYDIITLAHDASGFQAAVSGKYISKPLLPAWTMTLAVPVVALIILGLLGGVIMLLSDSEDSNSANEAVVPAVTDFAITNSQTDVVLGNPVLLEWQVADARTVHISYARPDQPPQEITVEDPATSAYQLLLGETGIYNVTLTVENTGGRDSRLLQVRVLPQITLLEADPPTLLQNVTQDVKFSWEVTGAAQLNGQPDIALSSSESSIIQAMGLPLEGAETFSVRPAESVNVMLLVRGNDGTENSQTLTFAIEPPRCVLSNPSATLYTGPGEGYPALAKIENSSEVVINPLARNTQNTWLQIQNENGFAWVRVADFTCEGFRTTQLDPELDIPPTPTPQPSATPTQTNTPKPTNNPTRTRTPAPTRTPPATATP